MSHPYVSAFIIYLVRTTEPSPLEQRMVIYDPTGRVASEVCNTRIRVPIL
jgi:hypothetical protein